MCAICSATRRTKIGLIFFDQRRASTHARVLVMNPHWLRPVATDSASCPWPSAARPIEIAIATRRRDGRAAVQGIVRERLTTGRQIARANRARMGNDEMRRDFLRAAMIRAPRGPRSPSTCARTPVHVIARSTKARAHRAIDAPLMATTILFFRWNFYRESKSNYLMTDSPASNSRSMAMFAR